MHEATIQGLKQALGVVGEVERQMFAAIADAQSKAEAPRPAQPMEYEVRRVPAEQPAAKPSKRPAPAKRRGRPPGRPKKAQAPVPQPMQDEKTVVPGGMSLEQAADL